MTALDAGTPPVSFKNERWVQALAAFGLLMMALCLIRLDTLLSMISVWWASPTYNHGFLVAPVAGALVWRRRAELSMTLPQPALSALIPMAVAVAAGLVGDLSGVNLARHVGFVGVLMSLVPLVFGWGIAKRFAFPILFLGFMVPVGDFLIAPLQELTADVSVMLLQWTGIAVYRDGLLIELPNGLFEVAEACAGVRFLIANIFVAALFAYMSYDDAWKWVVFFAMALAVPVIANCFRAYGIMLLAYYTDNELAAGADHLVYGWVFFAIVMFALVKLGAIFADRDLEDPHQPADAGSVALAHRFGHRRCCLLP